MIIKIIIMMMIMIIFYVTVMGRFPFLKKNIKKRFYMA